MSALAVVAGMIVGASIGGTLGMVAAFAWADMELGSLDALAFIAAGVVIGGACGAGAAAEWVA